MHPNAFKVTGNAATLTSIGLALLCSLAVAAACGDDAVDTIATSSAGGGTSVSTSSQGGGSFASGSGGATSNTSSTTGSGAASGTGGSGTVTYLSETIFSGSGAAFLKNLDVMSGTNGGQGGSGGSSSNSVAGEVALVGAFFGDMDFGDGGVVGDNKGDIFIVKLDATGSPAWSKTFSHSDTQNALAVTFDNNGDVILCGQILGQINFGGSLLNNSTLFEDVVIAKFSGTDGQHLASKIFNNGTGNADECHGIAVDSNNNYIITGVFQSTIDFGGASPFNAAGGTGDFNAFIAKFDSNLNHIFSTSIGNTANVDNAQRGNAIAVAVDDSYAIAGYTNGDVDFGGGLVTCSDNGERAFVAKYDANNNHTFSKIFSGAGVGSASAVAFHQSGDLLVTGDFKDTIVIDGTTLTNPSQNDDIFLARYDTGNALKYAKRFGSGDSENANDLAVTAQGFAVLAGRFNGSLPINGSTTLNSMGSYDAFVFTVSSSGDGYAGRGIGAAGLQQAHAVGLDDSDNVLLGGDYSGNVDFGGSASGAGGGSPSADIFVVKYGL